MRGLICTSIVAAATFAAASALAAPTPTNPKDTHQSLKKSEWRLHLPDPSDLMSGDEEPTRPFQAERADRDIPPAGTQAPE